MYKKFSCAYASVLMMAAANADTVPAKTEADSQSTVSQETAPSDAKKEAGYSIWVDQKEVMNFDQVNEQSRGAKLELETVESIAGFKTIMVHAKENVDTKKEYYVKSNADLDKRAARMHESMCMDAYIREKTDQFKVEPGNKQTIDNLRKEASILKEKTFQILMLDNEATTKRTEAAINGTKKTLSVIHKDGKVIEKTLSEMEKSDLAPLAAQISTVPLYGHITIPLKDKNKKEIFILIQLVKEAPASAVKKNEAVEIAIQKIVFNNIIEEISKKHTVEIRTKDGKKIPVDVKKMFTEANDTSKKNGEAAKTGDEAGKKSS